MDRFTLGILIVVEICVALTFLIDPAIGIIMQNLTALVFLLTADD